MQTIRISDLQNATYVGGKISVILASPDGANGRSAQRLVKLGCVVDVVEELYDAVSMLTDDPRAAKMLVVDCDAFGGVERCRTVLALLGHAGQYLAKVLITAECTEQIVPTERGKPYVLRAPLSAVALRVVMENAFGRPNFDHSAFMSPDLASALAGSSVPVPR